MTLIRPTLVSVTRTEGDEKHTRISYYVGDLMILDMDILKEIVPAIGEVDDLFLTQLLVTPHEHMAILSDVLSYSRAGKTSGPEWETLMTRVESLLVAPPRE